LAALALLPSDHAGAAHFDQVSMILLIEVDKSGMRSANEARRGQFEEPPAGSKG
jgi:hypothetical protein